MKAKLLMTVFVTVSSSFFASLFAQKNYYVVISAFSTEGDMKNFTMHLPDVSGDTAYSLSDHENIMQLYVWRTQEHDLAIARASQLQGKLDDNSTGVIGNYQSLLLSRNMESNKIMVRQNNSHDNRGTINTSIPSSRTTPESVLETHDAPLTKSSWFKFDISDASGLPITGKIHNVNYVTAKEIAAYDADAYLDFSRHAKSGELTLTCGIFGYKFAEKNIDFSKPALIEGAYQDSHGAWVIPYKLERLEKGDVSVMYNVAFHKDAVIMLSQSKDDLDELVRLMDQNRDYSIVIHGHCNGKNHRKIIAMGAEQQFFDVNGSQEIYGSAKKLSLLRSHAVKNYLLEHGIEERRIKTFGWGGSDMIANENSPLSKLNDRIEIEIRRR